MERGGSEVWGRHSNRRREGGERGQRERGNGGSGR